MVPLRHNHLRSHRLASRAPRPYPYCGRCTSMLTHRVLGLMELGFQSSHLIVSLNSHSLVLPLPPVFKSWSEPCHASYNI